jgi:hypothetical protein
MSGYGEAMKKFQQELTEIQKKCRHDGKVSDWREPDFLSGIPRIEFRKCEICGKVIAARTKCWGCGKWVEKDHWIEGDGSERAPIGTVFCSQKCKREYTATAKATGREVPPWIGIGTDTR